MSDPIRDYIYLDIDRIRSVYSQAAGGIIESITELRQGTEKATESTPEDFDDIGDFSREVLFGSGQIGIRVLNDYLFTVLERKLGALIKDVAHDTIESVQTGMLVRVSGKAEIDDIDRVLSMVQNFNDFFGFVLIAGIADELQKRIWALEDELEAAATGKRKKEIEKQLRMLTPRGILRKLGMGVAPLTSQSIETSLRLLYSDIFEVKIVSHFDENCVFRGILNKDYLREKPSLIYAKYGSRTQVNWTMVGQVTTIYDPKHVGEELPVSGSIMELLNGQTTSNGTESPAKALSAPTQEMKSEVEQTESTEPGNLRDFLENLYKSFSGFEEHLLRSELRKTWVVTPLTIYHEVFG